MTITNITEKQYKEDIGYSERLFEALNEFSPLETRGEEDLKIQKWCSVCCNSILYFLRAFVLNLNKRIPHVFVYIYKNNEYFKIDISAEMREVDFFTLNEVEEKLKEVCKIEEIKAIGGRNGTREYYYCIKKDIKNVVCKLTYFENEVINYSDVCDWLYENTEMQGNKILKEKTGRINEIAEDLQTLNINITEDDIIHKLEFNKKLLGDSKDCPNEYLTCSVSDIKKLPFPETGHHYRIKSLIDIEKTLEDSEPFGTISEDTPNYKKYIEMYLSA